MWRVALDALWATDKTVRDALAAAGAERLAVAMDNNTAITALYLGAKICLGARSSYSQCAD